MQGHSPWFFVMRNRHNRPYECEFYCVIVAIVWQEIPTY